MEGVKKKKKKKLGVMGWWLGVGREATSRTPHHLLPRLSEDRGRARSVGWRI